MNIISEKSLVSLFRAKKKGEFFQFGAYCCNCGKKFQIKVVRESEGFGLLGGSLYESCYGKLIAKCIDCSEKGLIEKPSAPSIAEPASTTAGIDRNRILE
jgi:hypothetical protein